MSRIVLVLYMFLILSQFTVTEVSQSIVLIMLTEVESHLLTLDTHSHRDELIDEPIAEVAHSEGVDEYYDDGEKMEEEYDKAIPCSGDESFADEDSRHDGTDDTTRSVSREHIECIVNTTVRPPIDCYVADYGYHESYKNRLSDGNVSCRRRTSHKTDDTSYGSPLPTAFVRVDSRRKSMSSSPLPMQW